MLCWWESATWKFGFIKQVDKGWITTVENLESWRFERQLFVKANSALINLFDKTKFHVLLILCCHSKDFQYFWIGLGPRKNLSN